MKKFFLILVVIGFLLGNTTIFAQKIILDASKKELNRVMNGFKNEEYPPYYLAYEIMDIESHSIAASFGKIIQNENHKKRTLDVDLRVGDYNFDNTHIIRGESFGFYMFGGEINIPIENDPIALRNAIWFETDKAYREAVKKYQKALTNSKVKVKEEDTSADFSREAPSKYIGEKYEYRFDAEKWKKIAEDVSRIFLDYDWLFNGDVSIRFSNTEKYFVNSEGSEIYQDEPYARIFISIQTKAEDGMTLPLYKSYFAFNPEELPSEEVLINDAKQLIETLEQLRNAPVMSTYSGPAILSGEASGVFFHEIFGHRVEGHRIKDPNNAQTFKEFLGEQVLPSFIDVVFDPNLKEINGEKLSGFYVYDDEGVKGQRVQIVENGILKNFLMCRTPIEGFEHSNGHGRRQSSYSVVSRQSNLIVQAKETITIADLKEKLREECKKQGKDFGLYFVKVQGGFTFTDRTIPNSFNVNPILVYKVFADGRPDEMVRGVDLIGTPLTTFSNIVAAADDIGIFNGICGAESGGVPVSALSPSLMVNKIEVQKKQKSQAKLPILPAPSRKNP